jgi:hypothetical protein
MAGQKEMGKQHYHKDEEVEDGFIDGDSGSPRRPKLRTPKLKRKGKKP